MYVPFLLSIVTNGKWISIPSNSTMEIPILNGEWNKRIAHRRWNNSTRTKSSFFFYLQNDKLLRCSVCVCGNFAFDIVYQMWDCWKLLIQTIVNDVLKPLWIMFFRCNVLFFFVIQTNIKLFIFRIRILSFNHRWIQIIFNDKFGSIYQKGFVFTSSNVSCCDGFLFLFLFWKTPKIKY